MIPLRDAGLERGAAVFAVSVTPADVNTRTRGSAFMLPQRSGIVDGNIFHENPGTLALCAGYRPSAGVVRPFKRRQRLAQIVNDNMPAVVVPA